jgi:hypothetical protein
MSTLKVTNIQATGETATRAVSGVAAAWVNMNGLGTVAIRDSMNVASLTDNGTGRYGINYASNMNNTNYCVQVTSSYGSTEAGGGDDAEYINGIGTIQRASGNTATGQTKIIVGGGFALSAQDHAQTMVTTHGDLA